MYVKVHVVGVEGKHDTRMSWTTLKKTDRIIFLLHMQMRPWPWTRYLLLSRNKLSTFYDKVQLAT